MKLQQRMGGGVGELEEGSNEQVSGRSAGGHVATLADPGGGVTDLTGRGTENHIVGEGREWAICMSRVCACVGEID